jgi:hypothetical protein
MPSMLARSISSMTRLEFNVVTGEFKEVLLTPEEESAALARKAAWDAENTLDKRAARAIDSMDRLQFEHLFDLENRTRVLELKTPITRTQYRQALINRWKELNPA